MASSAFSQSPQAVSVSPSSGTGTIQTFTFVYSDPLGAADLTSVFALFNNSASAANACYVQLDLIHSQILLADDAGTTWSGIFENSQCSLYGNSNFSRTGNTVTLTLAVTFKPAFAGSWNVYGYAATVGGLNTGSVTMGTWTVPAGPTLQADSLRPSSGTGTSQTFTFVYSDLLGAADVTNVYALFNNGLSAGHACYLQTDLTHNLIFLADDAGATWGSGVALGSSANLQNTQCVVYGAASAIVRSRNTVTLNVAVTFKPAFAGTWNVYGYASTAGGLNTGSVTMGTWTVPQSPPQAVSVSPSSGSGTSQTFSFVYSDPLGAADLTNVYALVNNGLFSGHACYVYADPVHNQLFLADDAGPTWGSGVALGSSANLQNSQCSLNAAASGFLLSGNTLTLNLAMTFKPAFAGSWNVYGYASTAGGLNTGSVALGTWTVPLTQAAPQAMSVSPSSGSGTSQTFSFVYSDPLGAADLTNVYALVNTGLFSGHACYVYADPVHNQLFLADDAGATWGSGVALGSSANLQNSQCYLNAAASGFLLSGNTLTLNLAMTFKPAFAGSWNVYGYASTAGGLNTGSVTLGTWRVPASQTPPQAVSVSPSSGSGTSQTFSFVYSDPLGAADLTNVYALVNNGLFSGHACYVYADPVHNQLFLADDAGSTWGSGVALGSSANLQNSQCSLNAAASGFVLSGNTLTLNLAMTFKPAFAGSWNVYGYASTAGGLNTGSVTLGTWTIP